MSSPAPEADPFAASFLAALRDWADRSGHPQGGDALLAAVGHRAALLAEQGRDLAADADAHRILRSASLAAAAMEVLQTHAIHPDTAARVVLAALSRWVTENQEAYSLARLGIRRDRPDEAFSMVRANFKSRGEQRFGAAFVYEQEVSDEQRSFVNIRRCLYHDFLSRIGMPQVTPIFCALDMIWAEDATHPRYDLRFERPTTLAAGGDACRFRFFKVER